MTAPLIHIMIAEDTTEDMMLGALVVIIETMKTEPNQALEPTTTAVTPRAFARVAPAAVAAHL